MSAPALFEIPTDKSRRKVIECKWVQAGDWLFDNNQYWIVTYIEETFVGFRTFHCMGLDRSGHMITEAETVTVVFP